jgi:hypothetical protein
MCRSSRSIRRSIHDQQEFGGALCVRAVAKMSASQPSADAANHSAPMMSPRTSAGCGVAAISSLMIAAARW